MNKEIQDRWVAALRSGKYQQGTGALNRDSKFCCLGVLCELAVEDEVVSKSYWSDNSDRVTAFYAEEDSILPRAVCSWADIESSLLGSHRSLIEMNDDERIPFEEIADLIEKHGVL